jgi:hypothetical protein
MTDRIKGLTVTIEADIREDDCEETIINAIRMIRGVQSVQTHVADMDHHFAVETARSQLVGQLRDVLYPYAKKKLD